MCFWRADPFAGIDGARRVTDGVYSLLGAISPVGDDGTSDAKKKYLVFLWVARTLKAES